MTDKVFICIQCGQEFAWTEDEQEYYIQQGLKPPLRCWLCRSAVAAAKKDKFRGQLKTPQKKDKKDS